MSTSIVFPLPDGATYIIPAVDDENWGQNVTNLLLAINAGVPPRNGTFSLTGDLSFGPSFGLVSQYYKSPTTNIAHSGIVRLAKTDAIAWRNNANSADLLLAIDGSNNLTYAGSVIPTAATSVASIIGTANQVIASSPTGNVTLSLPQSIASTSSPTFAGLTLSSPLTAGNGGTGVTSLGNLTDAGTDGIVVTGGTSAVITAVSIAQHVADASHNGYLSQADWSTFNGKQASLGFTPENVANKTTDGTLGANSNTLYPSEQAVKTYADTKQTTGVSTNASASGSLSPGSAVGVAVYNYTVTGALTISGPTSGYDGQKIIFRLLQDSSGHTVAFATSAGNFRFGTDIPSFTASSMNLTDYVGAMWNNAANCWDIVSAIQGF